MVRIRSCRFTAEMRGGRWKRAPVRVSSPRARAFSEVSPAWRRTTQTYSFPAGGNLEISSLLEGCAFSFFSPFFPRVELPQERHKWNPTMERRGSQGTKLTGTLLGLDEPGSPINAHRQTTRYFRIESSRMTRLLYSKNTPNPSDNFVGGRVGRFVEVDDSSPENFEREVLAGREGEESRTKETNLM